MRVAGSLARVVVDGGRGCCGKKVAKEFAAVAWWWYGTGDGVRCCDFFPAFVFFRLVGSEISQGSKKLGLFQSSKGLTGVNNSRIRRAVF